MMDKQRNTNRQAAPTKWLLIMMVFAVIVGLQLLVSGKFSSSQEISQQQFFDLVKNGKVDFIRLEGDRLEANRYKGNNDFIIVAVTIKDSQNSLEEVLSSHELNQAKLAELGVHVQVYNPPLRNNPLSIFITIGPILLLVFIIFRGYSQKKKESSKNEDYEFIE